MSPADTLLPRLKKEIPAKFERSNSTFLNPYSYIKFRDSPDLFENFQSIYMDGILLSKLGSLVLGENISRISFDMTSLAPVIFSFAESESKSIALVGGTEEVAKSASNIFHLEYPKIKIVETRNGFFSDSSDRVTYANRLAKINPDIVIVGMGTPLQEQFINDLLETGWSGLSFTCGGFFHQTASRGKRYYPKLIDKLNLRFLYRMYDEPKLIKRYALMYPKGLFFFIKDILATRLKPKNET